MQFRSVGAALMALALAACATAKTGPGAHPGPHPTPAPKPAPEKPLRFSDLPGWAGEDHGAAFAAWRATCGVARDAPSGEVCRRARASGPLTGPAARAFFEDSFKPVALPGEGVLTAYFAPEYDARSLPDAEFSAPVRGKPAEDAPLLDRTAIEIAPTDGALAWMRPEELFFLQIQGSGVLTFEDGRRIKALFAATNNKPFRGIANPMRDQGLLARDNTSGEAIRGWLAAHRGPEADAVMRLNPRYVYFRLAPDDGLAPLGAAGLPLPSGRAIAVDPAFHGWGEVLWLDATAPILSGAFPAYRRLVTALDTGGAIKGDIRADLYLGQGPVAGTEAGRVRHTLRMYRLVPRVGP